MGACTTKQDSVSAAGRAGQSSVPKQLSGLYLNRERRCLHQIRGSSIRTFEFQAGSMKLREDSAIGYLSERIIIVAGGTSSGGNLTKEVLILDTVTKQMKNLPSLPVSVKGGSLLKYSNFVYLAGAVDAKEMPCPLMRYSLTTYEWESIEVTGATDYAKLLYGGYFLIENKLYIVAGKRINSVGRPVSSKKIYYIDLDQQTLEVSEELVKYPMKATDLSCMSYKREAITIGGESQLVFRILFGNSIEINQIASVPFTKHDNFPGIFNSENRMIVFSFPKMAIFRAGEWYEYNAAVHYKTKKSSLMLCSGKNSRREVLAAHNNKILKKQLRGRSDSSEREHQKKKSNEISEEVAKCKEETKREEIYKDEKAEEITETNRGDEIVEFREETIENKVDAGNFEESEEIIESENFEVELKKSIDSADYNEEVSEDLHEISDRLETEIDPVEDEPQIQDIKFSIKTAKIPSREPIIPVKQQIVPKKNKESSSSSQSKQPKKTPSVTIRAAEKSSCSIAENKKKPPHGSKNSRIPTYPSGRFSSQIGAPGQGEKPPIPRESNRELPRVPGREASIDINLLVSAESVQVKMLKVRKDSRKLGENKKQSSKSSISLDSDIDYKDPSRKFNEEIVIKQASNNKVVAARVEVPSNVIEMESQDFDYVTEVISDEEEKHLSSCSLEEKEGKVAEEDAKFLPPKPILESLFISVPLEEVDDADIKVPAFDVTVGIDSYEESVIEPPIENNHKAEALKEQMANLKAPVQLDKKIDMFSSMILGDKIDLKSSVQLDKKIDMFSSMILSDNIDLQASVILDHKAELKDEKEGVVVFDHNAQENQQILKQLEEKIENPEDLQKSIEVSQHFEEEIDDQFNKKLVKIDVKAQSVRIDTTDIKIHIAPEDIIPEAISEELNVSEEYFEDSNEEEPEQIENCILETKESDVNAQSSSSSHSENEDKMPEPIESSRLISMMSNQKSLGSSSSSEDLSMHKAILPLSKSKVIGHGRSSVFYHKKSKLSKRSPKKYGHEELVDISGSKSKEASLNIEIRPAGVLNSSSKHSSSNRSNKEGSSGGSDSDYEISSSDSSGSRIISNSI